jgi:hypothetical protein
MEIVCRNSDMVDLHNSESCDSTFMEVRHDIQHGALSNDRASPSRASGGMVDALRSERSVRKDVRVRVPFCPPLSFQK